MPVYDYACTVCDRTVEVTHGIHAHGPTTCEVCGGLMRKLLSPPAIVFKGSGWAKKDARASSHAKASPKHAVDHAAAGGGEAAAPGDSGAGTSKASGGDSGGPDAH